ncbi:right-handed parallel beta-helix repeat-containing protein [Neolewinella antarctica]|uniref:Right handed beta helix domain-containing protein n=1 Tax=Neolewinella antarctica TaxID=442734 RepID=A0ABX0X7P2_9BACT|nr:right-handed parallel beta-helix repeat-containing protein [Neolewinella antarctica]NJC25240.1 hypothetical protein [Neolewinella antarctica]
MKLVARLLACCLLTGTVFFSGCQNNDLDFVTGDSVVLQFSTDTIMFDTVFTDRGSATQIMKVYNPSADAVSIDRITVAGATGVRYNFNINGTPGPEARDVVIFGNDSIFVFVEVRVDPTAPENVSPFIAEDRLIFETGINKEEVVLVAFGQNANYLNGFRRGQLALLSCQGGTFTLPTDLPTVIFGSLLVEDCTLRATAGTKIYFHGGIQRNTEFFGPGFFNDGILYTLPTGKIEFVGTLDNPVVLSTDRLEERFRDDPAKYQGIFLGPESRGNRIEYTEIFNSIAGVRLDSLAEVSISNSTIAYTGGPAVVGFQSDVTITNSLFHSNFGNAVQFQQGGNLRMDHVTVANYGVDASALFLRNFSLDEEDEVRGAAAMNATIRNSILIGSRSGELVLQDLFDGEEAGAFEISVTNSVVRTDNDFLEAQGGLFADFYGRICGNCVNATAADPLFRRVDEDDYRLDSLGVARNVGSYLPLLPLDIRQVVRDRDSTDAGAFQFVPGEE